MTEERRASARLRDRVGETIRLSREVTGAVRDALRTPADATGGQLAVRPELRRPFDALLAGGRAHLSARDHGVRELLFLAGAAALGEGTLAVRDASALATPERASLAGISARWVVLAD